MNKRGFCFQSPANPFLNGSGEIIQNSIWKLDYCCPNPPFSLFTMNWYSTTLFFPNEKVGIFFVCCLFVYVGKNLIMESLLTKCSCRKCRVHFYGMFGILKNFSGGSGYSVTQNCLCALCSRCLSSFLSEKINKQSFGGQMPIFHNLEICIFQAKHFSLRCWVYFLKCLIYWWVQKLKASLYFELDFAVAQARKFELSAVSPQFWQIILSSWG